MVRRGGSRSEQFYVVYRPNVGRVVQQQTLSEIKGQKGTRVPPHVAETVWKEIWELTVNRCLHAYWYYRLLFPTESCQLLLSFRPDCRNGRCRDVVAGLTCQFGMRRSTLHVLSGSLLAVWNKVEAVVKKREPNARLQARSFTVLCFLLSRQHPPINRSFRAGHPLARRPDQAGGRQVPQPQRRPGDRSAGRPLRPPSAADVLSSLAEQRNPDLFR